MLSVLCLILVLIYLYRNHLYNKLDRNKLSHSSYYDVTYGGERKCSGEVLRILRDVGGYKKILVNWRYMENAEAFAADIIMIHETGIYVVEAKDYQGWISGNLEEEYWVQTLCASQLTSYKNYFYNPLLKNEACIVRLQKELPDMKWLPYFPWQSSEIHVNLKTRDFPIIRPKLFLPVSYPTPSTVWCAAPENSWPLRSLMRYMTG